MKECFKFARIEINKPINCNSVSGDCFNEILFMMNVLEKALTRVHSKLVTDRDTEALKADRWHSQYGLEADIVDLLNIFALRLISSPFIIEVEDYEVEDDETDDD